MGWWEDLSGGVGGVAAAVGAAATEAWNTPAAQVAAGIATGGLSVAVQFIPGVGGPTEQAIKGAIRDPGSAAAALPGLVLQVAGPIPAGVAAVQAGARGAGRLGVPGAEQVANLIAGVGQAEREHPELVAAVVGGTALIATGAGTAAGAGMLTGGLTGLGGAALQIAVASESGAHGPPSVTKRPPPPPPLRTVDQELAFIRSGAKPPPPPPAPPGFVRNSSGGLSPAGSYVWPGLLPWLRSLFHA